MSSDADEALYARLRPEKTEVRTNGGQMVLTSKAFAFAKEIQKLNVEPEATAGAIGLVVRAWAKASAVLEAVEAAKP